MYRLHTYGKTEVGDDNDIPAFHITRPTLTNVPNLNSDDTKVDDPDKLPESLKNNKMKTTIFSNRKYHIKRTHHTLQQQWKDLPPPSCKACFALRRVIALRAVHLPFKSNVHGLLLRIVQDPQKIVIPHNLRNTFPHENNHAELQGGRKIYKRRRRHYYWLELTVD